MSDLQAAADRIEIEALRGEFTDGGMLRDGHSHLNYSVYHDRYRRTPDGLKFTERVDEVLYLDTTPRTGAPPQAAGDIPRSA